MIWESLKRFSDGEVAALLSDDTLVLCGKEEDEAVMKRYSIRDQVELETTELQDNPAGMTEVKLGGKRVLAVAYM